MYLTNAQGINDRGEIAGTAYDASTGVFVAYLAVPAFGGESEAGSLEGKRKDNPPKIVPPDRVRAQLTGFSRLALGDTVSK